MNLRESTYSNKYGAKSFSHVDAKLWNLLPMKIRDIHEIVDYKNALKFFEAPILNGNTVYLEQFKWGKERGGEKFFRGFRSGANTFFEVSNMGARNFFEVEKVGGKIFFGL